ncbi:pseudouridine synthase [Craterilacuibacter sp.]|uniref:pseudouridine synthase n=1 Tax=Craterilacuibacter sp. TaxID=2870909 RepID=UPI003F2C183C
MELYRFLQQQGFGSRKECRKLLEYGLVEINGEINDNWRADVSAADIRTLVVDDEPWQVLHGPVYMMLNKQADTETSHKPLHHPSVYSRLPPQFTNLGVSAVGRLDADTTGLLLLTTDGQFIHALTSPKKQVPKCYRVTLKHPASDALLQQLSSGVLLRDEDEALAVDAVERIETHTIDMTISQGRYHQVKRMVAAAGNRVNALHRIAIGPLPLADLAPGQWRFLTPTELASLGFSG